MTPEPERWIRGASGQNRRSGSEDGRRDDVESDVRPQKKGPAKHSTWMCSWVSDGFQGSGRRFGLKINYPIAKRQRQGNAPRMEPASTPATEIMKGEQRDDGRLKHWGEKK